ncbi:MAG: adenylosuccinate lyase [Dehalococcoidia bacterium]|nr:adenylosuccinate lyase [Dehalococcoidia bacterium]
MIERYTRPEMARIWSDENKFGQWLKVEIAACEAWADLGTIGREEIENIRRASFEVARINQVIAETHHDMTAFLRSVQESLGEESRFIHFGLTSNDVWDTALSLQLLDATDQLAAGIDRLVTVLETRAREHKRTLQVGRTHGVHAEPITFGLKLALWAQEMKRNQERLASARVAIGVGKLSGAVGTFATVPPTVEASVCAKLGLAPAPLSNQILQRDRHAQYVTTLAICAGSLEKFATEIRGLQRTEVLEAEEPFSEGQTGSSAMPHKRNPELCERVCGQARLIRGYAVTALENQSLWHERDISHSSAERVILADATTLLDYMLNLFTGVMSGLVVYPDNMRRNLDLTLGLVFSQRVLTSLIEQGMGRGEAYKVVQGAAMRCWRERIPFVDLLWDYAEVRAHFARPELEAMFDYNYYLRHLDEAFARVGLG